MIDSKKQYVFFLGNHPILSAIEIVNVLKRHGLPYHLVAVTDRFLILNLEESFPSNIFSSLGGTDRVGEVIGAQSDPWQAEAVVALLSPTSSPVNDSDIESETKKMVVGFSVVGNVRINLKQFAASVKKLFRSEMGVRIQFILPKSGKGQLNAGQITHYGLTGQSAFELTLFENDGEYYVARTDFIQDIAAYELRDTNRPVRDANVGLLPPKLAQIMLNLVPVKSAMTVYDPFCGMGTVLQEAVLMGHAVIGSDKNYTMVKATHENLVWLGEHFDTPDGDPSVWQHNAREPFPHDLHGSIEAVVTEPYLGDPLSAPIFADVIEKRNGDLSSMYLGFFRNATKLFANEGWIVFVLPAYAKNRRNRGQEDDFTLFPTLFIDEVKNLGYSLSQLIPDELAPFFNETSRGTLLYARPDALVGREITLWHIRKQEDQQI